MPFGFRPICDFGVVLLEFRLRKFYVHRSPFSAILPAQFGFDRLDIDPAIVAAARLLNGFTALEAFHSTTHLHIGSG